MNQKLQGQASDAGEQSSNAIASSTAQCEPQSLISEPSLPDCEMNQEPQPPKSIVRERCDPSNVDVSDDPIDNSSSRECNEEAGQDHSVKGKVISIAEKISILNYAASFTERETAMAFGISKTAVHQIKRKGKLFLALNEVSRNTDNTRHRAFRKTDLDGVNCKTWKWLLRKLEKGEHVTNKGLKSKAVEFAHLAGVENFTASNGWLYSFKKRFGVTVCRSKILVKDPKSVRAYLEAKESASNESTLSSDSETDEECGLRSLKSRNSMKAVRKAVLKGFKPKTAVPTGTVKPQSELYF